MKLSYKVQNALGRLYRYESVKFIKDGLRPLKHFIFGKTRMYRAIEELMDRDRTIRTAFDVGAAVGDTALTFLRSFPDATVYCFEPLYASFAVLQRRTRPYADRVKTFNFGFYNTNGEQDFYVSAEADGSSLVSPEGRSVSAAKQKALAQKSSFKTLDEFVRTAGIAAIDLLKIDVEGVEKELLEGARETLRKRVRNVFVEISFNRKGRAHPDHIAVFRMLNEAGFYLINNYEHENFYFRKLGL